MFHSAVQHRNCTPHCTVTLSVVWFLASNLVSFLACKLMLIARQRAPDIAHSHKNLRRKDFKPEIEWNYMSFSVYKIHHFKFSFHVFLAESSRMVKSCCVCYSPKTQFPVLLLPGQLKIVPLMQSKRHFYTVILHLVCFLCHVEEHTSSHSQCAGLWSVCFWSFPAPGATQVNSVLICAQELQSVWLTVKMQVHIHSGMRWAVCVMGEGSGGGGVV